MIILMSAAFNLSFIALHPTFSLRDRFAIDYCDHSKILTSCEQKLRLLKITRTLRCEKGSGCFSAKFILCSFRVALIVKVRPRSYFLASASTFAFGKPQK